MTHPAVRHRTLPQVQPLRRLRARPPWWRPLPWVVLLGLMALLRVHSQARLAELNYQSRRLDRLILEQDRRRAELMEQRAQATCHERLSRIIAQEGMVPPQSVRVLELGPLPPPKVVWTLPDDLSVVPPLGGEQLGQLPESPALTGGRNP